MAKTMLSYSALPGCRRTRPVQRTELEGFAGIIGTIPESGLALAASLYTSPAAGLSLLAGSPYIADSSGRSFPDLSDPARPIPHRPRGESADT